MRSRRKNVQNQEIFKRKKKKPFGVATSRVSCPNCPGVVKSKNPTAPKK